MSQRFFITGIGTGIGKTFVSAILTEALKADYWKPIQSGDLNNSDSKKVKALISNKQTYIHPEAYRLTKPLSPHAAAKADKISIDLKKIKLPKTENTLIIEGAGGVMVPLNNKDLIIDLIKQLKVQVIIVSQNYLGSINHTLLTIEALKSRNIPIAGIVFNGKKTPASEEFILQHSKLKCLLRINEEKEINAKTILKYSKKVML
jgi:dethiobiotin synthetase